MPPAGAGQQDCASDCSGADEDACRPVWRSLALVAKRRMQEPFRARQRPLQSRNDQTSKCRWSESRRFTNHPRWISWPLVVGGVSVVSVRGASRRSFLVDFAAGLGAIGAALSLQVVPAVAQCTQAKPCVAGPTNLGTLGNSDESQARGANADLRQEPAAVQEVRDCMHECGG
jgi:hypothetical protein